MKQILIALLLLTLCAQCKKKEAAPSSPQAYPVLTAMVTQRDVPVIKEGFGTLQSPLTVQLTGQVNGQIINMPVKEGSFVKQGDLIAQIDPRTYQAAVDNAIATLAKDEAAVVYAQQAVDSYGKLVDKSYVSLINFEQYQSNLAAAKAAVEADKASIKQAKVNLEYTRITAPFDGAIGLFQITQGNWLNIQIQNSYTITSLMQITPIYAVYALPEVDLAAIREYQAKAPLKVTATFLGDPTRSITGELYTYNNTVDLTTGTIMLKAIFPNTDMLGWPGQFVRTKTVLYTLENALIVPLTALQTGQHGEFVYVVTPDGTVEARNIVVGEYFDEIVVVSEGLTLGELVVIDGQINLYPGAPVQPQEEIPLNQA